jgi:hypothetical protein
MVAIRDGGEERWVKASEAPDKAHVIERRAPGEVYLETDRGERKATGSYYTPQYIVEYIVQHTLGPLVEEATARAKSLAEEAGADGGEVLVDEILDLKCLDPAMGSGHFLVEATEFLALELATDPYVTTEETAEEDLTYWKRRVVERCIYGVDKNPLAVELAKLSLWLATVATDRPLSFLDHHLKCGDSLIGARVEDLGWAPPPVLSKRAQKRVEQQKAGQMNMFEHVLSQKLPVVMGRILEITEQESRDYDTVRAKEAADQAVRELKEPFEAVADLWTSGYFGNAFEQGDYDEALGVIGRPDTLLELEPVKRARQMAGERRFFHWELAFPEVFYDEHGQPLGEQAGFDAVVGNPPYGMLQPHNTPEIILNYLKNRFETAAFKVDTFVLFIEAGLDLARRAGEVGMIVPNTFVLNVFAQEIRQLLLDKAHLRRLLVSQERLFPEADVHNAIFVVRRMDQASEEPPFTVRVVRSVDPAFLQGKAEGSTAVINDLQQDRLDFTGDGAWNIRLSDKIVSVLSEVESSSKHLDEIAYINRGLITGDRDKYFGDHQVDDRWCPILAGGDVYRYFALDPQEYVLFERPDTAGGCWDEEVHFHREKLLMRQIGSYPRVAIDREGYCVTGNIFTIRVFTDLSPLYVLTILNSSLIRSIWMLLFQDFKVSFTELKAEHINQLPIRRIEFTTPADERERLAAEGCDLAAHAIRNSHDATYPAFLDTSLGSWLDERLSADSEQSDVVHDLLAHLAERMIEMHEQKQERVEAFWLDLEGVTDPDTFEDLREHGKWGRSLWCASEDCRPFVGEESRSTRHLDESLGWNEDCFKVFVKELTGRVSNLSDVVGVYRRHHPPYRQLVQRIEATDRLIDQIVYRLYGLTEDEIAVVEGV